VFITSLHEAIFFYRQWQWHFSKSVRLERDHLEAKFEVLKAQLNPHFLFNSLNSLAAMLDGNAAAERYVEDLSYFMRYILKNRDNELIALDEELAMIHKYIALQKVRFEDNLQVKFSLEKDCSCLLIPPLSLQILLENCIKHNIVSSSKPLHIDIVCEGKMLSVSNKIQLKQQVESSGQGLRNIIERFSYYTPNEVRVENADGNFTVSLPLIQPQK
jgi:LytS/YehU family sensor histidine kinase